MRLIALLFITLLAACAGPLDKARHTLAGAATLVDLVDRGNAIAIRATCTGVADPADCVTSHHFDTVRDAIADADRTLRTTQSALDRLEAVDDPKDAIRDVLACVGDELNRLLALLAAHQISIPSEVTDTAAIVTAFIGGTCSEAP
jgi:hypothetical protein